MLMLAGFVVSGPVSTGLADVRLLSRESEIRDRETSLFFPDQVRYDEFASFSGAGDWDITLPHRIRHIGFASDTLIGGSFNGSYRSSVNDDSIRRFSTEMIARFEVTGEPASAMLEYRGQISPSGLGAADGNIVLSLTHLESGAEVFNIYRDGSPILWPQNLIEWRPATWSETLAIGTYEFRMRAFPRYTDFYGGGHLVGKRVGHRDADARAHAVRPLGGGGEPAPRHAPPGPAPVLPPDGDGWGSWGSWG